MGSPQGLKVKGTHVPVPRGMSSRDAIAPSSRRAGGVREDKVGLNRVTLPFKCLLCYGEPHSVITKEKARPPLYPDSVII